MTLKNLMCGGLIGLALTGSFAVQAQAQDASVLKILNGSSSGAISVAVNRAIVMESDRVFAELSVANPGIADIATLSDRTIYVLGKAPGRTTLTLLGPDGNLISNVDVRVAPDIAEFKERLSEILPKEPIEIRTANDGIVLSGRVSSSRKVSRALELAERYAPGRVTNLMMVGGAQQVLLKVRFAEMQRAVSKSLSSSVGIAGLLGETLPAITDAGQAVSSPGGGVYNFNGNILQETVNGGGAIGFSFGVGGLAVDLLIQALEGKGMVRTLAEPNLVAISGETAEFLAGGEYPIPVDNGDRGITIEYKPFGVMLGFTPTVIDGDLINLDIGAEVSALDTSTSVIAGEDDVFAFTTRRANTTVEMRDGQSFAIAGLLQDDFVDQANQVPWIGDVPILGTLFRSAEFTRRQSELVIIVTPHLVVPTDGQALSLPTDRMRIPSEAALFLNGQIEGSGPAQTVAQQNFQGAYGYVLE
ncbi:type II and III secretion system protein family protein [Oceanomicrobium pacificus]|uniref:General secretion pathway protein n=1 Tax=Oceanomicrobium pacificus TaxID=2692916 RepID=A0A6B0TLF2_9RHOB|nr:type II and III secretion system protein family protein [Oceanomicrobium pacificus]MXU65337.1 general secretion pathway protein [Oceanomicrobium pacificus]